MPKPEYRAQFDATVTFSNGGELSARDFRVDVPHAEVSAAEVGALFVASLSLLMVDRVEVTRLRVFPEQHKGTRGGPAYRTGTPAGRRAWVELSHPIEAGMVTYPGLPGPRITPHLTRAASRAAYGGAAEFAIDRISMVGNTGTYLDSPFHRYAEGTDLAGLRLDVLADLDAVVVRMAGSGVRAVDVGALAAVEVTGKAVLLHTGGDRDWGTPAYAEDAPYLTGAGARWLAEHGARLVGIDAVNIDDTQDAARPAHSVLLAAGIPVVEHLTGLDLLPPTGARFTAAPPRVVSFGTFPVRAYAALPVDN
jgi:kynurenine formamidase